MDGGTVLIASLVEDDYFRFLETLRDDRDIRLAQDEVVRFDRALRLIEDDTGIAILLLIGMEQDLQDAVRAVRGASDKVHIIAVSLESGTASLSLRDPIFDEFHLVIRGLLRREEKTAGKLLRFARRASGEEDEAPAPAPQTLPVPVVYAIDPSSLALIESALDWVEATTRELIDIWESEGEETGFLQALTGWLASWSRIGGLSGTSDDFEALVGKLRSGSGAQTPLGRIAALLEPDRIALKLFVVALAGDLDMRFNRSFGTLHNDFTRRAVSVGLACAIVAASSKGETPVSIRAHASLAGQLRALGLIDGIGADIAPLDDPLRVPANLLDYLATGDVDSLTAHLDCAILRPFPDRAAELISDGRRRLVGRALRLADVSSPGHRVVLVGGSAPGWIVAECGALAGPVMLIEPVVDANAADLMRSLRSIVLAARLGDRRLIVDLRTDGEAGDRLWRALERLLPQCVPPPLVLVDSPARLLAASPDVAMAVASIPAPSLQSRREAILLMTGRAQAADPDMIDRLASHVPADPAMLNHAGTLAAIAAADAGHPGDVREGDWLKALRVAAGSRLPQLASRIEPRPMPAEGEPAWVDTVILPELQRSQLRAVMRHVRYGPTVLDDWGFALLIDGRGVAALFAGESGTGKTMAAHAIASDLQADLYAIDLSQLVSKYIGETEKNLGAVFDDATRSGAVLLFDEADALFGKRSAVSDAHDRYANIEVSYLLQRLQQFPGLAILTSNHPESIDSAFTRRLRFRIDFPRPSVADRFAIWEQSIPAERRADGLDLKRLAFALDLTGGMIRMIAVHAAILAAERDGPITPADLQAAARGELIRLGLYDDLPRLDEIFAASPVGRAA